MSQLALDLVPEAAPSLENFVAGRNDEALAALRAMREARAASRIVYLWGLAGTGKSHLARAFAAGGRLLGAGDPVERFEWDERCARWAVDDVERLDDARQRALFGLFERVRAHPRAGLVVTGSAPPLALPLREDLRSRLGWGLVLELHALDDDEKAAALAQAAAHRGVTLAADVVPYLLTHASRDIRSLLELLDALDRFALERQRPLTLPLLREVLAARTPPPAAAPR